MASPYIPAGLVGFYARRVLKDLGFKTPPVRVQPVLEYFGIRLILLDEVMEADLDRICGRRLTVPAFLARKKDASYIFVRASDKHERQRLSIFHECGHFDIPWHDGFDYLCECDEGQRISMAALEKEAFEYAGRILFPDCVFFDDVASAPTQMATISILSKRYEASFEATAIRYIAVHPGLCAVLYLTLNPDMDETGLPFLVRYAMISKRFHRYWRPRTGIRYHDLIAECFQYGCCLQGEIPAAVFGSQKKYIYTAELKPCGPNQVCALLSISERLLLLI